VGEGGVWGGGGGVHDEVRHGAPKPKGGDPHRPRRARAGGGGEAHAWEEGGTCVRVEDEDREKVSKEVSILSLSHGWSGWESLIKSEGRKFQISESREG
jgi:hypothetical protein